MGSRCRWLRSEERSSAERRPLSLSCHLPSALGGLPVHRPPRRAGGRRGHGVDRRGATHPVDLSRLSGGDERLEPPAPDLDRHGSIRHRTLIEKLARLPHVQHVADAPYLLVIPLGPNGKALPSAFNDDDVAEVGSVGGMYFSQDRVTVAQGRMADPASTDEMVATAEAARLSGWHLGQTVHFGAYSIQQANTATFNPLTAGRICSSPPSSSASSCSRARSWTTTSIVSRPPCS